MRIRLLPTAAALALCVLALPFAANAQKVVNPDQAKNVTPATAKLPAAAAAANNKLAPPQVKTHLVLEPVKAYIGGSFDLGNPIKFDTDAMTTGLPTNCKIEVQVADWAPTEIWLPQLKSSGPFDFYFPPPPYFPLNVPESKLEGTFPLKARMAARGNCSASAWATTTFTLVKGPTKLTLKSKKPVALPPALALAAATSEETEVSILLIHGIGYSLSNRSVVVTGGAVDGQVPPSNYTGEITFRVLHSKLKSSQVQVAFMGDSAYQPANLSVTVP